MFGNIEWFKPKKSTLPAPASISGWLFYLLWFAAILTPTILMVSKGQYIQSGIWLAISGGSFLFDSLSVSRGIRKKLELDSLFFIGEDDSHVSTKNYDLNLRNSSDDS